MKLQVVLCLLIAVLLAGCVAASPPPPAATPIPSPTPVPPPSPAPTATPVLGLITATARELVLQRGDLPGGFNPGGQESKTPDAWTVLYIRPDALKSEYASFANLVSVISDVRVLPDALEAWREYHNQTRKAPEEVTSSISELVGNPEDVKVESCQAPVTSAEQAVCYRVAYRIGNVRLREYRYMFLSGNGLASLMLTALAEPSGGEPERLRDLAESIAVKQAERLVAARPRLTPGP